MQDESDPMTVDKTASKRLRTYLIDSLSGLCIAHPAYTKTVVEAFLRQAASHPSPKHRSAAASVALASAEGALCHSTASKPQAQRRLDSPAALS